jgi:hypothetical protein
MTTANRLETHSEKPRVVIYQAATGRKRTEVLSSAIRFGDQLIGSRWLAHSSGLVVQVPDLASPEAAVPSPHEPYGATPIDDPEGVSP